jgi:hypothetical protein
VCDELDVPLFIETHRGTVTQDLLRTVSYARQMERMRFTLDASHFVVAGELIAPDNSPKFREALGEIIARSSSIHARVSNGEQVQVDVGDGTGEVVRPYIRWWQAAFRQWSTRAQPGDFFPFVCELGPAPYSITLPVPSESGERVEISDRFAQALVFKKIADEQVA